ncbi:mitochondrial amidoxime-reducing component 1-like [Thrips palmi]|uniref:Mitochondrial amidoxime-reducing component 1-like n=1 Tax=Thrips palmi TaxID=161013 RepID=A0A6P8ZQF1_THRPL|nr:mitochondrial amidoxime-reducing component 1-like [Thrips palmi]
MASHQCCENRRNAAKLAKSMPVDKLQLTGNGPPYPSVHREASAEADLRLAFFPLERTDRAGRGPALSRSVSGIYADNTSYHAVVSASIDALNEKLEVPVKALNFRPNFVVEGPPAFADDSWQWMRIGQAVFKTVMPCGRCVLTTVNPETGVKSPDTEPLSTLRKFRMPTPAQKAAMAGMLGGPAPVMGNWLAIVQLGEINLHDAVYVYP